MTAPSNYRTYPLPANIPTATRCIQLELPDDPYFFRQFYGMLDQATQWFSYDRDTAHIGAQAAKLWKRVIASIQECPECPPTAPGFSVGEDMQIKQDPANPCLVREVCPDGSLGCVVIDISKCLTNPAPGGGVTPPNAGKCQEYNINFFANALTILPFLVNTGDTLTITSLTGAGSDGTLIWFCADGSQFIGGGCVGGEFTQSTDPLPAQFHMATVLKVNGLYYKWTSGVFTVPAGITNLPIYIGVNDAPINDNTGTYLIDFTYCNNAAVSTNWCQEFDFTLSPQGFTGYGQLDGGGTLQNPAFWTAGQGWQQNPNNPTINEAILMAALDIGVTPTGLSTVEFAGHLGNNGGGGAFSPGIQFGSTLTGTSSPTGYYFPGGFTANADWDKTGPLTVGVPSRYIQLLANGSGFSGFSTPALTYKKLILRGVGPNPFSSSNCT